MSRSLGDDHFVVLIKLAHFSSHPLPNSAASQQCDKVVFMLRRSSIQKKARRLITCFVWQVQTNQLRT
jgi:hypothetical protein